MAGRHPRAMRPRDERGHPVVRDAIEQGLIDTDRPYVVPPMPTHDAANEARKVVKVAGDHLGVSVAAWVADEAGNACFRNCQDPEAPHRVYFKVWSKSKARAHIVQQSGGDPANLKYNPFARGESRLVDDQGRRLR